MELFNIIVEDFARGADYSCIERLMHEEEHINVFAEDFARGTKFFVEDNALIILIMP